MKEDHTPEEMRQAWWILGANTFAFTVCFAAWMMNGVLITFLVDNGVHDWGPSEMGWLIGIPVLTGAIFRLPLVAAARPTSPGQSGSCLTPNRRHLRQPA